MQIKNIFLYAGVDKESYNQVTCDINRVNRNMIAVFSGIGTILIAIMCIVSLALNSTSQNRLVYMAGFLCALLLFLCSFCWAKKRPSIAVYLVYLSYAIFLTYGVLIGVITNSTQQTVTFMVMLVFLPVVFVERPICSILTMLLYEIIFITLCFERKTGDVLSIDVLNAIIYGLLGAISGTIITHSKVRGYLLEHQLHDASRIDQLTKMNNRNSFEADLKLYPSKCNNNLSCIYIDVNGLHELNNVKGHMYGDLMLQNIAEIIRENFGSEVIYRVGGDEFVAFAIDFSNEKLEYKIQKMNENIEKEGYHVAVGCDCMEKDKIKIEALVNAAESNMYKNKSEYYKKYNVDRRSR